MSAPIRRRLAAASVGGLSLAVAGYMAPGAYAANTVDGDVDVSNTETVQVLMSADGSIDAQRVYEQTVLTGDGTVDIANPVSTKNLRNLDGFGGFDVREGQARIKTDVSGEKKYRSVSDFTKKLPLTFDITYLFNGKKVDPADVVGRTGDLEVRYVVTNVTGQTQDVAFKDGSGNEKSSPENVVIPMVSSLTTVLPSSFTKVSSAEANAAGDGRGGTQLSFTMTLIPPIGNATAEFGYKAHVEDAELPKANVSALPVNPLASPSFKGGAASYEGGAQTGQDLTAGATEIDANVLKLRDGANELVSGLVQLRDGADQLNAGLAGEAAPGAAKLAAGAGQLDSGAGDLSAGAGKVAGGADQLKAGSSELADGAGKVADGAGSLADGAGQLDSGAKDLSDGLKSAGAKAPELLAGLQAVEDGVNQVDAGLVTLGGGGTQISNGATQLIGAVNTQLVPGLDGVTGALDQALAVAGSLPDSTQKAQLQGLIGGARNGVASIKAGLTGQVVPGLQQIKGGGDAVTNGVGAPAAAGTLRNGMARLKGGVDQLQAGGETLVDGLGQLSAGADRLKAGTGDLSAGADTLADGAGDVGAGANKIRNGNSDLADGANQLEAGAGKLKGGTSELAAGAGTLAAGLGVAAAGSGQLAEGLGTAAESAPKLPEGAERLSKEGTTKLVEAGNATASDYGLKYALIEAGAERASTAQPYGSPEGATELTAYKFEIAGENGAESANLKRGVTALVLLAAAGVLTTLRRRSII